MYEIGDIVRIREDVADNYDEYKDRDLRIIDKFNSVEESPLYDESLYPMYLYELEDCDFLLYEYELEY